MRDISLCLAPRLVTFEILVTLSPQFPLVLLRFIRIHELFENVHKYRCNECRIQTEDSVRIHIHILLWAQMSINEPLERQRRSEFPELTDMTCCNLPLCGKPACTFAAVVFLIPYTLILLSRTQPGKIMAGWSHSIVCKRQFTQSRVWEYTLLPTYNIIKGKHPFLNMADDMRRWWHPELKHNRLSTEGQAKQSLTTSQTLLMAEPFKQMGDLTIPWVASSVRKGCQRQRQR